MHKLFGGGKKASTATNLQIQKSKQIESLVRKVSAIEILPGVEYRVVVKVGAANITLIVALTAQFPQEKPIVTVTPAISHLWVDPQSMHVIGCPNINNFSMHSDLGQAVQAIVDEFKKTPPVLIQPYSVQSGLPPTSEPPGYGPPRYVHPGVESFSSGPPPVPPRYSTGSSVGSPDSSEAMSDASGFPDFPMPNLLKAFPHLKDKKLLELQTLVENDDLLLDMLRGLPELMAFADQREALSEKCVCLAKANLFQKPKIEVLKQDIVEKMASLDALRQSFESSCEQHLAVSEQFRPSNIQTNLKVAILQAEEESELIVDSFLSKSIDVEEFTQQFLQKRKLCHLRKAKEEKLSLMILSQDDQF